jgi:cytochrome P450
MLLFLAMKIPRPPGPRDRFFGFPTLRAMQRDYIGFWRQSQRSYGDTVYLRVGAVDIYGFMHPADIRALLVDKAASFIRYQRHMAVLAQLQGQSVLIAEGASWQRQRRMLQPSFNLKRFDPYAAQVAQAAAGVLDSLPAATPFDFESSMNLLAMDVVLRTMFGGRIGGDTAAIEAAVRDLSLIAYNEMFTQFSWPDWLPLPGKARKRAAMRTMFELIGSHVTARRAAPAGDNDLLDTLLSARDEEGGGMLSDVQVRDELMTIFFAGHETTAAGLTWAGWFLASQPEAAARAQQEVDAVLGGRTPGYADVAHLPYLAKFIKETMRLFPPAPGVFMRRASEDVQIGQWQVPKGALVSVCSLVPHYDERWFADPLRFDPERFDGEAARQMPRGAYLPFGAGPRVCLGSNFATMEMTLVLAMLLQRFRLAPAPGQAQPQMHLQVIVRPAGGLRLVLEARAPLAPVAPQAKAAGGCSFHAEVSLRQPDAAP